VGALTPRPTPNPEDRVFAFMFPETGWPSHTRRHWVLILVAFYDTCGLWWYCSSSWSPLGENNITVLITDYLKIQTKYRNLKLIFLETECTVFNTHSSLFCPWNVRVLYDSQDKVIISLNGFTQFIFVKIHCFVFGTEYICLSVAGFLKLIRN
jgi:hypothetical protein